MIENDQMNHIEFHKTHGNHKSTEKCHQIISDIITEDIEQGFALPLLLSILDKLPNASLAPLGW
jgi:hypothetical protein